MLLLPKLWLLVARLAKGLFEEFLLLFRTMSQMVAINLQIGWQQISFLAIG
jgi:hypothetical protein